MSKPIKHLYIEIEKNFNYFPDYQCSKCFKDGLVVYNWIDVYPEGSMWYRDKICVHCGYNHESGYHESESRLAYYKRQIQLKTAINYEI